MKPELQKLFEGVNGLSTEFLDKVSGLLESKVSEATAKAIQETEAAGHQERLTLVEAHQTEIAQLKESHIKMVAEKVDSFINAVVEEWANKNAPAIDAQIKTEAAEKFLSSMTGMLKEAGVNFAPDTDGQIAALTARLTESEQRGNAATAELNQLKEGDTNRQRKDVIDRVCEGLVETKKDTVIGLLEGIAFGDGFESRVRTFRNLIEGKDDFKDNVGKDDENKDKKPDGDKSEKDKVDESKKSKKEGDDDKDDDDKSDKDDTDKEMNESVKQQIQSYLLK